MADTYTNFVCRDRINQVLNDQFVYIIHHGHTIPVLCKFIKTTPSGYSVACEPTRYTLNTGEIITCIPECVGWHYCDYGLWEPVMAIVSKGHAYLVMP